MHLLKPLFWSIAFAGVYVSLGNATYAPTVSNLDRACVERPSIEAHRYLWPLSWALSSGVRSRC